MFSLQVEHLLKYDVEKLKTACHKIKIVPLDDDDFEFLREYHSIITPVAIALKTLESSQFSFGLYLPTLIGLRIKLGQLVQSPLFHCKPLVLAIQDGFETRFKKVLDIFDSEGQWIPLYLGMVTNPRFKLNYLGMRTIPSHISNKIRSILFNAGKDILEKEKRDQANGQIQEDPHQRENPTTTAEAGNNVNVFCVHRKKNSISIE